MFHPYLGKIPILTSIFFKVQPPPSHGLVNAELRGLVFFRGKTAA